MAVTFIDEIHPKYGLKIKFKYVWRPYQYLDFFGIISISKHKFFPLDLSFENYESLQSFLHKKGIVFKEIAYEDFNNTITEEWYFVDTSKIYDNEELEVNRLLKYKYYSINEVAKMLSFSRPTIYKLINNNELTAMRIHDQIRINHFDLSEFLYKKNQDNKS